MSKSLEPSSNRGEVSLDNKLLLTDDHTDMLAEIFNMGMGHSLGALSKLTGREHEITFAVPKIQILSKEEFFKKVNEFPRMAMVIQEYSGEITGNALLYFPAHAGKELARLLIGSDIPLDQVEKIESDALTEIGNIFINSSISCLANFLGKEIETEIPELIFQDRLSLRMGRGEEGIIHLNAQFNVAHLKLEGEVAFSLFNESIQKFIHLIDAYIGNS